MDELEEYVQAQLPADEAVIQELNDSIKETLHLFSRIEFEDEPSNEGDKEVLPTLWPYWILDNDRKASRDQKTADARPTSRLSQSTTSMIIAAILAATSYPENRSSSGYRWGRPTGQPDSRDATLASRLELAVKNLAQQWKDPKKTEANEQGENAGCALSGTFGHNDILTISWHLDIFSNDAEFAALTDGLSGAVYEQARQVVLDRIDAYALAPSGYDAVISSFNSNTDRKRIVIDSSYNLLRFVRCIPRVIYGREDKHDDQSQKITRAKDRAFYRFESRLLAQLSYFSIEDSHFDGSELAFCLEGMLQLRPNSVNDSLLKRVMQVMEEAQRSSPSWSSDMPIIGDHKGQILYPASVEIGRSLLASISIYDLHNARTRLHNSAGSRYLNLIKRYWTWLKTRRTTITTANYEKVTGWHSEHLNDTAVVHTWETSQILEFCIAFRDQMLRYISRRLLVASRLKVDWPTPETTWPEVAAIFEPVTSLGDGNKVYAEIGKTLIVDHSVRESKKNLWSVLLYGPPGTGKSDLAYNIAKVMQVPLLTITVSDFLAEGESRMENRAKLVFDALERQTLSVVLFDELDQFLLDRNSKRFRDQDSVFQFLTPGMLTKLQALRKAANVIFVVATNYEERIDLAIKRRGRMDRSFLLLPPDSEQRIRILSRFKNTKDELTRLKAADKTAIVRASAFLGYKDLELIAEVPWRDMIDLIRRLDEAPRHIQFHSYLDRFEKISDAEKETQLTVFKGPRAELVGLIRLAHESWKTAEGSWTDVAKEYACGRDFFDAIVRDLIDRRFEKPSKDSVIEELRKQHGITISM